MIDFIVGHDITLCSLELEDIINNTNYLCWMNDLSLDIYTERNYFPNTKKHLQDFYNHACTNTDLMLLGIKYKETHVGNITFSKIDNINHNAFIAYMLGDRLVSGKGIITNACIMLMYYGFQKLNFERIYGGVSVLHKASIKVCKKVGLEIEGTLKHTLYRNGEYTDSYIVAATRDIWLEIFESKALDLLEIFPTY